MVVSAIDVAAGKSMTVSYGLAEAAGWLEGVLVSANPTGPAEVGLAFAVQDVNHATHNRMTSRSDKIFIIFFSKMSDTSDVENYKGVHFRATPSMGLPHNMPEPRR